MSSVSQAHPQTQIAADGQSARSAELMKAAKAGDRSAYGQVALMYQDRIFNAVLRLVGDRDEARELTQETLLRGLEKMADFRGDAQPYTWLFRIAINLAISQLRKVKRHRTFSLDAINEKSGEGGNHQASGLLDRVRGVRPGSAPAEGPTANVEAKERAEQVLAAMGRIDPDYRAVLVMRDVEDMDYQQMADVLGLPLGTLKSRLFRARLALRDELKAYMKL